MCGGAFIIALLFYIYIYIYICNYLGENSNLVPRVQFQVKLY